MNNIKLAKLLRKALEDSIESNVVYKGFYSPVTKEAKINCDKLIGNITTLIGVLEVSDDL